MRITNANAFDNAIDQLGRRKSELDRAQTQLTSLKRVHRASDDPAAAARAERALAAMSRADASQRAVQASRHSMSLAESTLGSAGELLQQARELIVAGGNGSYSEAERAAIAQQLRGVRGQLFVLANSDDGAGGYLFGGQGSSAPPFVDAPGGVQYLGSAGERVAAAGQALPLSVEGDRTWLAAPSGNGVFETASLVNNGSAWIDAGRVTQPAALTGAAYALQFSVTGAGTTYTILADGLPSPQTNVPYVSGQSIGIDGLAFTVSGAPANGDQFAITASTPTLGVFGVIDRTAQGLATPLTSLGQIAQNTAFGLRDLDAVLARLQSVRAATGEALTRIDSVELRVAEQKLEAQMERSNAQDLDMVQAISHFQNQQSGYDAALKSYALVQRMSLFQYLSL